ncbi:DAHP synthase/ 3-phosphoshikimate 1-carboxyvinyltransferase [Alteracholeplasma palmae J233]|uniref:3-phosphoshikimate 1-carboxyvinyltransferase n=1 Tax=Alteracholeplasma palmae (strain ATCC 49389 / J233) TaxID=1318466 RepID=U4KLN5_ALTPJ|nr:3-phosphoshikimate 1-carboxyvinyltransferase [Alteracholeplasma palmae]CCV64793.1 DAHP synthase/ 3-phosphoshikimate 1-carboxyvinyltransferase [Alteracholeplasma palmae J233]
MIIKPSPLSGTIKIVSSKSLSHRYIIAAGLSEGMSKIENVLDSDDLTATKKALEALGVTFSNDLVRGTFPKLMNSTIDAYESGSTIRFMIPIAMLQEKEVTFIGRAKLPERPLDVFEKMFIPKNYTFKKLETKNLPLLVKGPLNPGAYRMPGNVSSQFLTGLLYVLPLLHGESVIELTTDLESRGYVDLTLKVLKEFGIKIEEVKNKYIIPGNQKYQAHDAYVEGDFSQAAFFLVAGTIENEIRLQGLNKDSLQGDKEIISIIQKMGGKITFEKNDIIVQKAQTHGMTIDLSQIPDLGPILFVLAALSEGTTHFINCQRLKIKESDRLTAMYNELKKLGADLTLEENGLIVNGVKEFKGNVTLETYGDHRIAMALAIASIRANAPITLLNPEVVNKSYPTFFEEFEKLGGDIKI